MRAGSAIPKALALTIALALGGHAATASADADWRCDHPRRAEVNARLNRLDWRIAQERRGGEIGPGRAGRLYSEDRAIRREERRMVAFNGGYLTRPESRFLNAQENFLSAQIGR
jgi:hypothetical protein